MARTIMQQYNAHNNSVSCENRAEAIVLPMDGFHLDNAILDKAGFRGRKGAPHTFDVEGFASLLSRVKQAIAPIYAPMFDRESDLSRNCAIKIDRQHQVVLVEGNYLLLDQPGWRELSAFFDLRIGIEVDMAVIEKRLIDRWLYYGFSRELAIEKAKQNDLPNAQVVNTQSQAPDIVFCSKP